PADHTCLMKLPMESWMSHLPCALWDTPLYHLAIPGSHNAITYCLDMNDRSPVDLMQPDLLQKLDKYMKPLIRPFVYKWAITQVATHRNASLSLDLIYFFYCWLILCHFDAVLLLFCVFVVISRVIYCICSFWCLFVDILRTESI
uniref:Phosphatidylinositol-specific phospholipase C, X domain containing 1 n=1 Tax=Salarias fasciatus TaxID=181472 RepID=A0A672HAH8_SALFA